MLRILPCASRVAWSAALFSGLKAQERAVKSIVRHEIKYFDFRSYTWHYEAAISFCSFLQQSPFALGTFWALATIKIGFNDELNLSCLKFRMKPVLYFKTLCKGTFALRESLKVRKGSVCNLQRNPLNDNGKWWSPLPAMLNSSKWCAELPCPLLTIILGTYLIVSCELFRFLSTDTNCVDVMAPKRRATIPDNYENGERIWNVSRDQTHFGCCQINAGSARRIIFALRKYT